MNQDSSSWPGIALARNTGCRRHSPRRKPYKQPCVRPSCNRINLTIHHHQLQLNKGSRLRQLRTPLNCRQRGPRETSAKCRASNHLTPKQIPLILDVVTSRPWSTRIAIVCAGPGVHQGHRQAAPKRELRRAAVGAASVCNPPVGLPHEDTSWRFHQATPDHLVAGPTTGARRSSCTLYCASRDGWMNESTRSDCAVLRRLHPILPRYSLVAPAARVPAQSGLRSEDNRECDCQDRI